MLAGKVAVVTGAGRGIGREIALGMAAEGAAVIVNDIGAALDGQGADASPAQQAVDDIHAAGGQAAASYDSVADWDAAQRIVQSAVDTFGRIDIVVNSAGILRDAIFHKMEPAEWDAVLKVHLYGAFHMSRAAAPHFRAQGSGSYVHMVSTSGLIGSIGQANYAAAKLGIAGLSRSLAMDMSRFGVRSNCIAPHAFSRMIESVPGASPEEKAANLEKRRKQTRADQIAPLAVFLASDAAAGVSGQIFGARGNEVYLYSQPRPIRTLHRGDGWTPESLAAQLPAAWKSSLTPLERTRDVFGWEAI
ncbi:SDR family NAD(P)-dependent oxidoreductase [Candidimonas nitroreducens]|uniref:3-hydroxyacyl-CoA dehydrogenase n=1 Tax=Candidimonas nitroreducens TaxID=683354 RepID=A0A225MCN0_9BURK|nr:SDR family NAD(P)-dependent oxidoreductase [Candidimonas nitroreducens]OWT59054.1 3-hydroxyacyl-CoA dehydrogenase [Candidimonas nitroreducens]